MNTEWFPNEYRMVVDKSVSRPAIGLHLVEICCLFLGIG